MLKKILLCSAGIAAIALSLLRHQQKRNQRFSNRFHTDDEDTDEFYFDQPDCGLEIIRFRPSLERAHLVH